MAHEQRALAGRVLALESFFRRVQAERMHDVPILNPALQVQALGFVPAVEPGPDAGAVAEGVLLTPWFMSLLRLPLAVEPAQARVGRKFERVFGNECFEFIGAHDPGLGYYEACALFSPMACFSSQADAIGTAQAVCKQLRERAAQPAQGAPALPSRRAFFLPRGMAAAAEPAARGPARP